MKKIIRIEILSGIELNVNYERDLQMFSRKEKKIFNRIVKSTVVKEAFLVNMYRM